MAETHDNSPDESAEAEIHDLSSDAIHESGGVLTIRNPELARLIHSKLATAAKSGAGVAARPRIRIRIHVRVSK